MSPRTLAFSALVCLLSLGVPAYSETLDELVKKEEGVELGPCALSPRPKLSGDTIHAVVPSRFPGVGWVTNSLLLVGVDAQSNVQGMIELKVRDDVPPREVVSVECSGKRLVITLGGKVWIDVLTYSWDGQALHKRGAKRHRKL